ncbi:hypothetical protein O181_112859 [Austropuccinia psidii MF-1]|uniref:Reverse transcriptase domain-containing protein n=1 Tax=Austropuccinia psidii MF-1 TaxID=1389203 RepID=A0A9Q3K4R6_9BASI|nr:hypothetical protein [Austropuccinia psidii MF-1]
MISDPELELSMSDSNRYKSHSKVSNRHLHEPLQAVLQSLQGLNNKKQITTIKNEEKGPEKDFFHRLTTERGKIQSLINRKKKEKLIDLLFKYKNSFETDKEPLGPAYPASPRVREALEVHIKEFIDLVVLRKVGHNEQLEVTTPVIITWNNGKSRMVGDFRALKTYTIPERYPNHRIHETLTQLSQVKFIKAMDALKGFHQNVSQQTMPRNY